MVFSSGVFDDIEVEEMQSKPLPQSIGYLGNEVCVWKLRLGDVFVHGGSGNHIRDLGEWQGLLGAAHLVFVHVGEGLPAHAFDVLASDIHFEDDASVVDKLLEDHGRVKFVEALGVEEQEHGVGGGAAVCRHGLRNHGEGEVRNGALVVESFSAVDDELLGNPARAEALGDSEMVDGFQHGNAALKPVDCGGWVDEHDMRVEILVLQQLLCPLLPSVLVEDGVERPLVL